MAFTHHDLRLIEPSFNSSLTDLIIELDYLRKKTLSGTTHPLVFFQLKKIFHTLESIGSARIEGNNTTIAEYIETKMTRTNPEAVSGDLPQNIREIVNIEQAMTFIEENIAEQPINRAFVSEMHKMIVEHLLPPPDGEGDRSPGIYRAVNLAIHKADHTPPEWTQVEPYMTMLFDFVNRTESPKYDLLKAAIAHHRFVWIHPFGNGNGRTVRLFTYAMLIKTGFNVNIGRIINPTAIFCSNRSDYYTYLSQADTGTDKGILLWCEYVLSGLKNEIEKIDKLMSYDYLRKEVLLPAVHYSLERQYITDVEAKMLRRAVERQVIQASDVQDILPDKSPSEISRHIRKLLDNQMLQPEKENARKYVIRFDNNFLLRGIIHALDKKGFLPIKD